MARFRRRTFHVGGASRDLLEIHDAPRLDAASLQALAETIQWCSLQTVTATPDESDDFRRRRQLVAEANVFFQKARSHMGSLWSSSDYSAMIKTKDHEQAMALLRKAAIDTLHSLGLQLRSSSLEPTPPLDGIHSNEEWQAGVAELINKRTRLLQQRGAKCDLYSDLKGGRMLGYRPAEDLCDGAAQFSSNDFFTVHNCPPWDIWVHFSEGELFSWVPEILIPLAQAGIDANPEGCIYWADQF